MIQRIVAFVFGMVVVLGAQAALGAYDRWKWSGHTYVNLADEEDLIRRDIAYQHQQRMLRDMCAGSQECVSAATALNSEWLITEMVESAAIGSDISLLMPSARIRCSLVDGGTP